jgi:hypothetical protein
MLPLTTMLQKNQSLTTMLPLTTMLQKNQSLNKPNSAM